ncbi:MAG: hypothetical protein R3A48_08475 [Polyangiales bacterium]
MKRALALAALLTACRRPAPTPPREVSALRDVIDVIDAVDAADAADAMDAVDAPVEEMDVPAAQAPVSTAPQRSPFDSPIAESWPVAARWTAREEQDYARFVSRLGAAVRDRRCGRVDRCLRDPSINTLFDPTTDARLRLDADCADLPYVLRGYFAFKRRLPFGFVAAVRGTYSASARYVLGVRPTAWRAWTSYRTPREAIGAAVDTAWTIMYRTPPETERSDFYPVQVRRDALRPGSIYYDPNGHVLVVSEVRDDGQVYLIDGHPDGSLTWKRFGAAFALGTRRLGGGFKNHRPLRIDASGALEWIPNAELTDRDDDEQWDRARWLLEARPVSYPEWVRGRLARPGAAIDPVQDFREQIQALCRDISDRAVSVDLALAAGIHRQRHPGALPWNIYGTTGDWETWSTPSRDARLKTAVQEMSQGLDALPATSPLRPAMRAVWDVESVGPECRFRYTNSVGATVNLSLATVLDRLFDLSFDPYHCPELRWGAPEGSDERSTCPDTHTKLSWYRDERRLRNRLERVYGVPTPTRDGPAEPPAVDPRPRLGVATTPPAR